MRVLFLQPQPCIRALKYAQGFKNIPDVEVYFGYFDQTLTEFYGYGDELFEKFIKLDKKNPERGIKDAVEKYDVEIIHSHNAPDFLTASAIKAVDNLPVIHDNHDVLSLRKTKYGKNSLEPDGIEVLETEKFANEKSDGRIYVTEGLRDYVQRKYRVNPKRDLVFCNYVPESMIPDRLKEKLSRRDGQIHIVYEGTVDSVIEGSHYDLRDIFKEIASHGMHMHIYVSHENEDYKKLAEGNNFLHYHGQLDPKTLLQELTQYDFGWAGFNTVKNKEHLDVVLSNKLIEYIVCGLPVLSFPHKTQKKFIEEHGVGFVVNDLEELGEQLKSERVDEVHSTVLMKRFDFTVEKRINEVVSFYRLVSS